MRCANCFNCSGKMVIKCEHEKGVWVGAHSLPVFAQCDMCGHAPSPRDQPEIVQRLLQECLEHGSYKRDTTYVSGRPVRCP